MNTKLNNNNTNKPKTFKSNANESLFFKVIKSEKEFKDFYEENDIENTFNSTYSVQIFDEHEVISGFHELKILVALTPLSLFPCYKITYEEKSKLSDDIDLLMKKFLNENYNKDQDKFKEILNKELNKNHLEEKYLSDNKYTYMNVKDSYKDTTFNKEEDKEKQYNNMYDSSNSNSNRIVLKRMLKADEASLQLNQNLQYLVPYFIYSASEIPVKNNFWEYYLLYDNISNDDNEDINVLVGFCTVSRFHLLANKHRAMISQFFILPCYQRKGYGQTLLNAIYNNTLTIDECFDLATEDPVVEYIYLRDIVLFSNLIKHIKNISKDVTKGFTDPYKITTEKEYGSLARLYTQKVVKEISIKCKISDVLTLRYIMIYKYLLSKNSNDDIYSIFTEDLNSFLVSLNKEDFNPNKALRKPMIYLYDEPDFNVEEELKSEPEVDFTKLAEKLQELLDEGLNDFKHIEFKCLSSLKE